MVAVRTPIEPTPCRREERFSEDPRPSRFEASVEIGPTDGFAAPRRVDTLTPTPAPPAAEALGLRSKQVAAPSGGRVARLTPATKLRAAIDVVLAELARIAFSDIGEVFDAHGAVIPFADLPPGVRSAIAEYRVHYGRNGTFVVSIRMHSKVAALATLGRHLGIGRRRSDRARPAPSRLANNTNGEGQ